MTPCAGRGQPVVGSACVSSAAFADARSEAGLALVEHAIPAALYVVFARPPATRGGARIIADALEIRRATRGVETARRGAPTSRTAQPPAATGVGRTGGYAVPDARFAHRTNGGASRVHALGVALAGCLVERVTAGRFGLRPASCVVAHTTTFAVRCLVAVRSRAGGGAHRRDGEGDHSNHAGPREDPSPRGWLPRRPDDGGSWRGARAPRVWCSSFAELVWLVGLVHGVCADVRNERARYDVLRARGVSMCTTVARGASAVASRWHMLAQRPCGSRRS